MISIVGGIACLAALVGLSIVGIRRAMEDSLRWSTQDAVLVMSMGIAQERQKGRSLTPAEIEDLIRTLINGSVINGGFDRNQKARDLCGTPFRVSTRIVGTKPAVTGTSAGPDRLFDTSDDLTNTATSGPCSTPRPGCGAPSASSR